jgi:hypothetical protein
LTTVVVGAGHPTDAHQQLLMTVFEAADDGQIGAAKWHGSVRLNGTSVNGLGPC